MNYAIMPPMRGLWSCVTVATVLVAGCHRAVPAPSAGPTPTFAADIAPILYTKCAPCHRAGELAPFPMLSYDDAARWAQSIAIETRAKTMPPWLPEPQTPEFAGVRRLTAQELDLIQRWYAGGAPAGDLTKAPAPPAFASGWQGGTPDVIATMPRPFVLPQGTRDSIRNVVLRVPIDRAGYVRAVELLTGGAPIHHAVIRVDPTAASRQREGVDGQPGFEGMASAETQDPDGHFIGWTPGRGPIVSPDGLAWRLERGADLVVELHLIPARGKPSTVQPQVALYFTDTPPQRSPVFVKMGSKAIDIPAGAAAHVITDTFTMPSDAQLLSVYPHAHYLARQMQVTASFPDGRTTTLLEIRRWNFRWQQDYRFSTPVALPRGTRLDMRYVYDNSAANPDNPHTPPQPVYNGPASTDEMATLGVQLLPATPEDGRALVAIFDRRETEQNILAGSAQIRRRPDDTEGLVLLGGSLVDAGRHGEALPHLERAVRLAPQYAPAQNYYGGALLALGRVPEAARAFAAAATAAPRDERYQVNLGIAALRLGQDTAAQAAFERALALNRDVAAAHANLGLLWFQRRQFARALPYLTRAVELQPNSASAESDLGAVLAALGRTAEAEQHLRRALALDPNDAAARQNLARLRK